MPLFENSRECSVGFDYDAVEEDLDEAPSQPSLTHSHDDLLEFGRRLVSLIRARPRARFTVDCLHIALGDALLEGTTMTDVARANGVTKAAVSKRTRELREALHLRANANNKPDHTRRVYARTNRSPIALDSPRYRSKS